MSLPFFWLERTAYHDAIAHGMIPPGVWAAASAARASGLILRDRCFGIRLTRKPLRLNTLDMVCSRPTFGLHYIDYALL